MKTQALKYLIKEAVREAIQEELKEVLLEALKSPKMSIPASPPQPVMPPPPSLTMENKREKYANILGETAQQFTTNNIPSFNPQGAIPGGDLPAGELNMNQIMGLMSK